MFNAPITKNNENSHDRSAGKRSFARPFFLAITVPEARANSMNNHQSVTFFFLLVRDEIFFFIMLNQSSPVGKTAFDSLQAKQSAVSAGYDPIVVQNAGRYKDLLRLITSEWKIKNQTPLVNAGYTARVLVISQIIHSFIRYHQMRKADRIQIVLLGCGADVIGLWAHSLCPEKVVLLEVDTPDVCSLKKDLLLSKKIIIEQDDNNNDSSLRLTGHIRDDPSSKGEEGSKCNYYLCPMDLKDISGLDSISSQYIDNTCPTLAVSELVLSYLQPKETDSLLQWCSSMLCTSPNSCTVALEPLGSEGTLTNVIDGYKRRYCELFESKMERGQAKKKKERKQLFVPIGSSCEAVARRFVEMGYEKAHVANLGRAAAFAVRPKEFQVREIFDEHAALVCYLKSYAVTLGFSADTDGLMQRMLCPWKFPMQVSPSIHDDIAITTIDPIDEEAVRDLVYQVYEPKFEDYPAVRKMVKTMMNSDLSIKPADSNNSVIASRYSSMGGLFLVALEYGKNGRQMVGCVGVRPYDRKEKSKALEVVRLAVDPSHRGKGIGRKLLEMVEMFSISRGCTNLTANTISILESAISLYQSCDYKLDKEASLGGNLTLLTYTKQLGR